MAGVWRHNMWDVLCSMEDRMKRIAGFQLQVQDWIEGKVTAEGGRGKDTGHIVFMYGVICINEGNQRYYRRTDERYGPVGVWRAACMGQDPSGHHEEDRGMDGRD